jgi:hypothetical protein
MIKARPTKNTPVVDDFDGKPFINEDKKNSDQYKLATQLDKIKDKIPLEQVKKWYQDDYTKQWEYNKLPNIANAKIDKSLGSYIRMNSISSMKYEFTYDTMDMIIVVFKLYDYGIKKETNYGTLFCEIYDNITPLRKNLIHNNSIYGNITFSFYSTSPSHISCDGEYRSRFSIFNSLVSAKENFADIWNELDEYIVRAKSRRQWSLYSSYFYPKLEHEYGNTDVEHAVKSEFIPVTLLIISWFHIIFDEIFHITKTHINKNYKDIFLKHRDIDINFIKAMIKKYGINRMELFRSSITNNRPAFSGHQNYIQCGYKMIPLNYKEVQEPLQLRYKPWREYFISNKLNDLVINSISPNFPITLDWFYIKNSGKGLFDNKSQYDRMKNSELAKDILHTLYEAQRGTYFATTNLKTVGKSSKEIRQWISNKFKRLSEKIDEPINYSIEEIIMSEVTLGFASEYVGRTVADIISLTQSSTVYNSILGYPLKENGYDYFAKYMFEICYGLLCANSKLGVIHGDFHLNNATIGSLYYLQPNDLANKDKKNKVVYVLDDEFQFVFPNNGYFSCVIDFSRSIIDPARYNDLKDISLPVTQKFVKDEELFRDREIRQLLRLYISLFPTKKRQENELLILFKNNFDAVFKLLTCIDLYMFTIRLSRLLGKINTPIFKKVITLVDMLNRLSERYIASDMNYLINDPKSYGQKIIDNEYPILSIIKKCFPEYIDGKAYKSIGIITDVYVYNNPLQYSLAKYETFPDFFKYAKYYDKQGKIVVIPKVTDIRKSKRIEYEKQKTRNLEIAHYISLRHKQKVT